MARVDRDEPSEELIATTDVRERPQVAFVIFVVRVLALAEAVRESLAVIFEAHLL